MRILDIARLVAAPFLLLALLTPVSAASTHDLAADAGSGMTLATAANSASALYALEATFTSWTQSTLGLMNCEPLDPTARFQEPSTIRPDVLPRKPLTCCWPTLVPELKDVA